MDIKEKVAVFEESCKKMLRIDVSKLNSEIDTDIEKQIEDEVNEYQDKEEMTYNKKVEKLEKDFNKQIYSMELESKKEVLNQKKIMQKDLKKEVTLQLQRFVAAPEYKECLLKRIDETIAKIDNTQNSILSITENDKEKYGDEIKAKYNIILNNLDNKYIGGCILENNIQGLYIDNTILNSINEKLDD